MVSIFKTEQADHEKEQSTFGKGVCTGRMFLLDVRNEGEDEDADWKERDLLLFCPDGRCKE